MPAGFDVMSYAAANARLRGLLSRLLDDETWDKMVHSGDLRGAIALLKTTRYARDVEDVSQAGMLSLEQLEHRLNGEAAESCRQARSFTGGNVSRLLLVWWQHFELENLKALFRGLDQRMAPDVIRSFLIPLGEHETLPWETLLQQPSVSSLIDRLRDTHYINPLRAAFPAYERERSMFPIEIALDIRYYRDLAAAIAHLSGADQSDARRILGTRLDILNILWAYRYRVYYGLSAEEIVNYTLWHTIRTDAALVRDIALGADPRDIVRRVWGTGSVDLTPLQGQRNEAQMLPKLELALERFWRQLALREIGGYPFKLGAILGYLVLEELEVQDLVTLLESKGMGWDSERIDQHMIRFKE